MCKNWKQMNSANTSHPKAYFWKMIMLWVKENNYKEKEPTKQELLMDSLEMARDCYCKRELKHYFNEVILIDNNYL